MASFNASPFATGGLTGPNPFATGHDPTAAMPPTTSTGPTLNQHGSGAIWYGLEPFGFLP